MCFLKNKLFRKTLKASQREIKICKKCANTFRLSKLQFNRDLFDADLTFIIKHFTINQKGSIEDFIFLEKIKVIMLFKKNDKIEN